MRDKRTIVIVNVFIVVAVGLCLQGCSRTPPSIDSALVIGINNDQDTDNITLQNAATDADAFGEALPCNTSHLSIVADDTAQLTRAALLSELRQFAGQTRPTDVAWLMMEGSGVEINGEDYFYTEDSQQANGSPVTQTMISLQDILQALKGMQAKELIITLAQSNDHAQAHSNDFNVSLSRSPWNVNWKIPPGVHSVVAFNCSCSGQSTADGPVIGTPYFTYFVEKGLKGGAADQDGEVKLGNLIRYVQLGVASNIALYGGKVEECTWSVAAKDKSAALDIVLSKNLKPGLGGESSVSLPSLANNDQRFKAAMLRAFELRTEIEQSQAEDSQITAAIKAHTLPQLLRTRLAPVKRQFLQAILFDPNSPRARYELGILEVEMKDFSGAQVQFETAMILAPSSTLPIWRLAILMQSEKKYQQAENLYKKAIQIAPAKVTLKYDLAMLYEYTHQLNKAEKLLAEIVEENPQWSEPLNALSYVYYARGEKAQAVKLMQKAYNLDPDNTDALDSLAWAYCHSYKNYPKSEQLFRRLIKLSPERGLYRMEFAECLLLQGKTDEARSQAKKAIDLGWPANDPFFKKLKGN